MEERERRFDGRGDWIRTSDLFVPNEARYQAAPRPEVPVDLAIPAASMPPPRQRRYAPLALRRREAIAWA